MLDLCSCGGRLTKALQGAGTIQHSATLDGWVVGTNKAFLKHWHAEILNSVLLTHHAAAIILQGRVRTFIARAKYVRQVRRYRDECAQTTTFMNMISRKAMQTFSALQTIADEEERRGPTGLGIVKVEKKKKKQKAKAQTAQVDTKRFEKEIGKQRKAAIKWWMKSERPRRLHVGTDGKVHMWFHGLITRVEAEQFLFDCVSGTFLFRVSERYHGYAISVKIHDRIKHYKVSQSSGKKYLLDGVDIVFDTLIQIVGHYRDNLLPSLDGYVDLLRTPLMVLHDLNLGIDNNDKLVKGDFKQRLEQDTSAIRAAVGGADVAMDTSVSEATADDSVFLELPPGKRPPLWMRGAISRAAAIKELQDRSMVDGRFLIRLKERSPDKISLAISYSYERKIFHHILLRRKGHPWILDNTLLQFADGLGRKGSLEEAVVRMQTAQLPQLATMLEQDGLTPMHVTKPPSPKTLTRGLKMLDPNTARTSDDNANGSIAIANSHMSALFADTSLVAGHRPLSVMSQANMSLKRPQQGQGVNTDRAKRSSIMNLPGLGIKPKAAAVDTKGSALMAICRSHERR